MCNIETNTYVLFSVGNCKQFLSVIKISYADFRTNKHYTFGFWLIYDQSFCLFCMDFSLFYPEYYYFINIIYHDDCKGMDILEVCLALEYLFF